MELHLQLGFVAAELAGWAAAAAVVVSVACQELALVAQVAAASVEGFGGRALNVTVELGRLALAIGTAASAEKHFFVAVVYVIVVAAVVVGEPSSAAAAAD